MGNLGSSDVSKFWKPIFDSKQANDHTVYEEQQVRSVWKQTVVWQKFEGEMQLGINRSRLATMAIHPASWNDSPPRQFGLGP